MTHCQLTLDSDLPTVIIDQLPHEHEAQSSSTHFGCEVRLEED